MLQMLTLFFVANKGQKKGAKKVENVKMEEVKIYNF